MTWRRLVPAILVALFAASRPLAAGVPIELKAETLLYGDNTEFFNPYRTGETTFGAWLRLSFSVHLGEKVALDIGAFGNERFGSEKAFEIVRPILTLRIGDARGRLLFGTLETVRRSDGMGPDLTMPHGLLPPIQIETYSFTRPYENGLQWILDTEAVKSDAWLNWQKLNTSEHREELEAGSAGRVHLAGPLWLGAQFHIVHHGGQLHDVGPVSDSLAWGVGLRVAPPIAFLDRASAEAYALFSRDDPDRKQPELTTSGRGLFLRLAVERNGWRGHLLVWRAADFVKQEGDPNYLSRSGDGTFYRSKRSYGELGLAKVVRPVSGVELEASFRLHRIDTRFEYSYRLIARAVFVLPILRGRR